MTSGKRQNNFPSANQDFPKVMGMLHKLLDFSMLVEITANVAHTSATFIAAKKEAAQKKS